MKKITNMYVSLVLIFTFFASLSFAQVNLNKGLIVYYPFNGNAKDASGNGNDGTVENATLTNDRYGHSKSAYSFDGSEGITAPLSNVGGPTGGTMSFWMKSTMTTQGVPMVFGVPGTIWLNLFTTGLYVGVYDGSGGSHSSSDESKSTVNDGKWYNLTATNDGSTTRIYVNGALENTYSDDQLKTSVGLVIGAVGGANNAGYTGILDDVRIYFRQLSDSEVIAVYQMPYVSFSNKNGCVSDSIHFNDSSIAVSGSKYLWDFGDGTTSTSTNPAHLYSKTGSYTVTLTIITPYGASDNFSKTVNVTNGPSQPTITQSGHILLTSGGVTYQWSLNGTIINGADLSYYQPTVSKGSFTVTITDSNGCSSTSNVFDYDVSGINNQLSENNISIYPNPVHDEINIDLSSNAADIQSLQIIDMNGRCIKSIELSGVGSNIVVSSQDIVKGMYIIRLTGKENTLVQKVLVE